jgi:hypothetical protein
MAKTYGYDTAVRVNTDFPYRIATGTLQYRSDTHDVTDTEGATGPGGAAEPRRERGIGLGEAELTLTAFLDPAVGLHVAPYNFRIQQIVPLIEIYAGGLGNTPDLFRDVLIDDVRKDPVGDPQQPNRVTIHGFCQKFLEADMV